MLPLHRLRGPGLALLFALAAGAAVAAPAPVRPSPTDSLLAVLQRLPADTNRLATLVRLCNVAPPTFDRQPYAEEGLRLARQFGQRPRQLFFQLSLMHVHYERENYLAITRSAHELLRLASRPPVDYLYAAQARAMLGIIANAESDFPDGRRQFRESLRLARTAPSSTRQLRVLAYTYRALASSYWEQMEEAQEHVDSLFVPARRCIRETIRLAYALRAAGDEEAFLGNLTNSWDGLADLATQLGQLDSASFYRERAIDGYRQLDDERLVLTRQQQLADLRLRTGHYAQAVALAQTAQRAAHRLTMPIAEAQCYETLALALDSLGRSHEAVRALRLATALRDAAFDAAKRDEITRLQVAFETERKEARIRELARQSRREQAEAHRQRQYFWLLAVGLLITITGLTTAIILALRLRRSRTQLAALSASKDRLYAVIAHDLRGPVQSLEGVAGMISHFLDRQQYASLRQLPPLVGNSVRTVNQLLDNLLHWAASQTGELAFHPAALPAQLLLDESAALWGSTALAHQIELRIRPAPPDATVWADPQMARTVLRNLVGNALKFTPSGGCVTLAVEALATGTALVVTDTGPGLSADEAAALLRPVADAKSQRGAHGETGSGLGLRLCRLFLDRHRGHLQFDGKSGVGTTVRACFPAAGAVPTVA